MRQTFSSITHDAGADIKLSNIFVWKTSKLADERLEKDVCNKYDKGQYSLMFKALLQSSNSNIYSSVEKWTKLTASLKKME